MHYTIYRVQDTDGYGPYRGSDSVLTNRPSTDNQPLPFLDDNGSNFFPKESHRFGFLNIDQYYNWFDIDDRSLLKGSYKLYKITINKIFRILGKQIVYDIDDVIKTEETEIL